MSKFITRILATFAVVLIALATALCLGAPSAVADPAAESSSTTVPTDPVPTDPVPTNPAEATTTTQTPPPITTTQSPPATTTTPPDSTTPSDSTPPSSTTPAKVGQVAVTAIDLKTGTEVEGIQVTLRVGDVRRTVATPSLTVMPAGTVAVTVTDILPGYNWSKAVPSTVTLEPNGLVTITVKLGRPDLRGAVSITKRDRITGAVLNGAQYWVSSCANESVGGGIVTGADGIGSVWLPSGCYRVRERLAPLGYHLDPTVYTVTVEPVATQHLTLYDLPIAPVVVVRDPSGRVPIRSIPTGRTS